VAGVAGEMSTGDRVALGAAAPAAAASALLSGQRPSRCDAAQGCWSQAPPGLRGSDCWWDLLAEEGPLIPWLNPNRNN